jgi:hypothetical protein
MEVVRRYAGETENDILFGTEGVRMYLRCCGATLLLACLKREHGKWFFGPCCAHPQLMVRARVPQHLNSD